MEQAHLCLDWWKNEVNDEVSTVYEAESCFFR